MVRKRQAVGVLGVMVLAALGSTARLSAQTRPNVHFQHAGAMPPGAIGSSRLRQGGPLSGYFQPVEIRAPRGARISLAAGGAFGEAIAAPVPAGLLIGPVYRLRVTEIPRNEGVEIFPTIEVIDRIYPPPGETRRFPIPIDLTQEELELAAAGKFVTRVVYLEDPHRALPRPQATDGVNWFQAREGENPLEVADRLGRPVAIIRIGSRQPDSSGPSQQFLFGSPPWMPLQAPLPGRKNEPEEIERP